MTKEQPYKQVIIFGPDHNDAFSDTIDKAPKNDDCLIIGDGNRSVSLKEIEQILAGKINEATRIDICSHGLALPFDPAGIHRIILDNFAYPTFTYTSSLFGMLTRASQGKSIYTHLWSCCADNADREFSYLPEGSLAVFHSSKNTYSTQRVSLCYGEYNGSLDGVKKNLVSTLHSVLACGGTVKFSKSGNKRNYIPIDFKGMSEMLIFVIINI